MNTGRWICDIGVHNERFWSARNVGQFHLEKGHETDVSVCMCAIG